LPVLFSEDSAEIRCITPLAIGALTALYAGKLTSTPPPPPGNNNSSKSAAKKTPAAPCIILAGSHDGRVAARLLLERGQQLQDLGQQLVWPDADRLSVRRLQLLDLTARGASELTGRFLLAKANFVAVAAVRLAYNTAAKSATAWRMAEVKTLASLNGGLGAVVGMEVSEEGELIVASQKGPVLRYRLFLIYIHISLRRLNILYWV
jgi:hypothetical protein